MATFKDGRTIPNIWYAGKELEFVTEVDNNDEAQALLNSYRNSGFAAACKHRNGKHQVYREK